MLLPFAGTKAFPIDKSSNAVRKYLCDLGDDRAAEAVSHQNEIRDVSLVDVPNDRLDTVRVSDTRL